MKEIILSLKNRDERKNPKNKRRRGTDRGTRKGERRKTRGGNGRVRGGRR